MSNFSTHLIRLANKKLNLLAELHSELILSNAISTTFANFILENLAKGRLYPSRKIYIYSLCLPLNNPKSTELKKNLIELSYDCRLTDYFTYYQTIELSNLTKPAIQAETFFDFNSLLQPQPQLKYDVDKKTISRQISSIIDLMHILYNKMCRTQSWHVDTRAADFLLIFETSKEAINHAVQHIYNQTIAQSHLTEAQKKELTASFNNLDHMQLFKNKFREQKRLFSKISHVILTYHQMNSDYKNQLLNVRLSSFLSERKNQQILQELQSFGFLLDLDHQTICQNLKLLRLFNERETRDLTYRGDILFKKLKGIVELTKNSDLKKELTDIIDYTRFDSSLDHFNIKEQNKALINLLLKILHQLHEKSLAILLQPDILFKIEEQIDEQTNDENSLFRMIKYLELDYMLENLELCLFKTSPTELASAIKQLRILDTREYASENLIDLFKDLNAILVQKRQSHYLPTATTSNLDPIDFLSLYGI